MANAESPSKLTGNIGVKVAVGDGVIVGGTVVGGTGVCVAVVGVAESESIWVGETIAVTLCTAIVLVGESPSEQADKPNRIKTKKAAGIPTTCFCADCRQMVPIALFKNEAVCDALSLS